MWKDFIKTDLDLCLKEDYQFFLVRPKGLHPGWNKKFTPSVVQLIVGKLYSCDNELEPIIYSHKDDFLTPSEDPFECNLEWCEIPE